MALVRLQTASQGHSESLLGDYVIAKKSEVDAHEQEVKGKLKKKPRTRRRIARKNYLKVAKNRNPSYAVRRKAIGQQLKYIKHRL
jgi:hypothetical protein